MRKIELYMKILILYFMNRDRISKLKSMRDGVRSDDKRREEINVYLRDKVFSESSIQEAIDMEERKARIEGNYLVHYEKASRSEQVKEFLMSCKKHELYPGMLLVVDDALGSMSPTEAGIARGSININISTFANTIPGENSRIVKANKNGNLGDAVNDAISDIVGKFATSGESLVADFHDNTVQGMSLDELSIKANCSAKFLGIKAAASFEQNKSGYSTYFMTDYRQVFFTASAEVPTNDLSELFADHITVDDIKRAFGDKPIIFVKSVNYGRQLYMLEELSGSNQKMVASIKASGYGVSVDSEFKQSNSKLQHDSKYYISGGDVTNANLIFGVNTSPIKDEKDIDFCLRQMAELRKKANEFKQKHTRVTLKGGVESDINGVVLSYKASMLCGPNPTKDITFWKSGEHMVKRIVPNTGMKVEIFNCLKDNNIVASGYYTKFDSKGNELPEVYDLYDNKVKGYVFASDLANPNIKPEVRKVKLTSKLVDGGNNNRNGRIFCKTFLTPAYSLGNGRNIYRIHLTLRNRDKRDNIFNNTYILPCGDIMAGYLREGKKGGESVNWYFGGSTDVWYNDY
jgi:hypothetical protein